MFGRWKVATLVAEFLGTSALTLVFLSVQRSTIGVPYFVALAAGLTVILFTYVFGEHSGAHLNPAITLALWTARKVSTITGILYIIVQLLGAWAAYGLYTYFVNSSLQPIGSHYQGRILVVEAVGTLILALGWGAAAYRRWLAGTQGAVVGLAYALAIIVAASAGIGLANPAVALGVRAWEIWGSMGWLNYVLGPVLGAVIGVNLYGLLFAPVEAVAGTRTPSATAVGAAEKPVAAKRPARKTTTRRRSTSSRSTRTRR